jgi:CRP-like cAMP-binding protein
MPLQSCTLFAGEDHQSPYNIFVLANLVTVKPYQIGEVIQKQGQQADDSMYLVVRGYCRAVFESTLIKLKPKSKAPQFSNSKETFGELGVLMRHLKSEKSDYF